MRRLAIVVLCVVAVACEDRGRNDAQLFLSRVADIDENAPLPVRAAEVRALEQLVVTNEDVRHAKDTCVHAHTALLRAEAEQAGAREALERATAGHAADGPLRPADQHAIQASIEASNAAIADARDSFPACQNAIHQLERRYGAHHGP